ncbi:MAG: hypothetical protein B7Y90_02435 [Alphaproteobacteria bacterium 32-64-14]|nr:MAG: hypothetical protein B7Y90_02435 [Alphaproteobacteria bacterium 32-64-14]
MDNAPARHDVTASPLQPGGLAWVLGVFALLLVLFFFRAVPLALDPPRQTNAPDQFDTARAIARLGNVIDGTPHPVDSAALHETRTRLLREITALGYAPEIRVHNVCQAMGRGGMRCALVQNVFFRTGPKQGPALVLTAHYDSVDASPGFGDDGIGLAVWLEVAHLLKQQTPVKPVVFLFTDGEETGLLGAQAFVDNRDAYDFEVGRIINLEARGVRGPAMMFETGHPNAALVTDWSKSGARSFSNSMMTAVYELLPNSTDLTVHLIGGSNGINIAISDGVDFYHTNHDDLAMLDRASVQHMGDQALGATRAFLASDWSKDSSAGEIAYADIGSRLFVSLPQVFALVLVGLCFGVAAMLLIRPTRDSGWRRLDWRAFALPPALFAAAGLGAFVIQQVFGLIRPEPAFWTATPQALNMTIFAATLLIAALALGFLAPRSRPESLFAAGWFWFIAIGMGISLTVPGFAMLHLIPGVVFVIAGGAAWLFPRYQVAAYGVASAFLALIFFPLIQLLDVTMSLVMAPVFGVVEAMVIAPMLALIGPLTTHRRPALYALGGVLGGACIVTFLAPAYTIERPLALNLIAHYDMDEKSAALFSSARAGALPAAMREQLAVGEIKSPPGAAANLPARKLDFSDRPSATVTALSDTLEGKGEHTVILALSALGARSIRLRIPVKAKPLLVTYDGHDYETQLSDSEYYTIEIVGLSADGATIDVTLGSSEKMDWLVQGVWSGLPQDAQSTANLRPDTSVRIQSGDVTITTNKQLF